LDDTLKKNDFSKIDKKKLDKIELSECSSISLDLDDCKYSKFFLFLFLNSFFNTIRFELELEYEQYGEE